MKKKTLFLLILFITTTALAQKKTVAISTFEAASDVEISAKYIKAIEDKVKAAIKNTNRFKIVDRANYRKLLDEREFQKKEEFIDGKVTSESAFEGAEQIVTGNISQVSITKRTSKESFSYKCNISFSLEVIDIATGKVIASEMIQPKQTFLGNVVSTYDTKTPEKAFFNSLKGTQKAIDKFVAENFPVTTQIIEITKATSSKAKTLLLNTGNMNGAKEKQAFKVVELVSMNVNGKEIIRKKEIGTVRITNVEGDEISEAKVIKGGNVILERFNAGAKIECYSKN
ncbi:peptidoglycan-synthase activator LpoB [Kordia sp. SMS9]|uniref:CsgG/HfaB family protein n=1 Tax=Kordia sp. SMS9 TaxID=2282170 RepID=UPI000E0D6F94|nr:CsgG/HfaB family protein [Kordia sp. SMS9]AXG69978.1 peptidoglycan-synthase activator LpoB [Kordia sp. SMS9]